MGVTMMMNADKYTSTRQPIDTRIDFRIGNISMYDFIAIVNFSCRSSFVIPRIMRQINRSISISNTIYGSMQRFRFLWDLIACMMHVGQVIFVFVFFFSNTCHFNASTSFYLGFM